jgi:hypothetical protein
LLLREPWEEEEEEVDDDDTDGVGVLVDKGGALGGSSNDHCNPNEHGAYVSYDHTNICVQGNSSNPFIVDNALTTTSPSMVVIYVREVRSGTGS